jgi:hypothetical protein
MGTTARTDWRRSSQHSNCSAGWRFAWIVAKEPLYSTSWSLSDNNVTPVTTYALQIYKPGSTADAWSSFDELRRADCEKSFAFLAAANLCKAIGRSTEGTV